MNFVSVIIGPCHNCLRAPQHNVNLSLTNHTYRFANPALPGITLPRMSRTNLATHLHASVFRVPCSIGPKPPCLTAPHLAMPGRAAPVHARPSHAEPQLTTPHHVTPHRNPATSVFQKLQATLPRLSATRRDRPYRTKPVPARTRLSCPGRDWTRHAKTLRAGPHHASVFRVPCSIGPKPPCHVTPRRALPHLSLTRLAEPYPTSHQHALPSLAPPRLSATHLSAHLRTAPRHFQKPTLSVSVQSTTRDVPIFHFKKFHIVVRFSKVYDIQFI